MTTVILSPGIQKFLTILIFLFIPISIISPHAMVWEVIFGGLIGIYYSRNYNLPQIPYSIIITLLAIPIWGLVTTLWSKFPFNSLLMSLKILALIILGIFWCRLTLSLDTQTRKSFTNALIGGLFVGIFFLIIDNWLQNPWQHYWLKSSSKAFAQASLMFSLATWPAILWAIRRPYSLSLRMFLIVSLIFCVSWTLFQMDCDTAPIGLLLGLCAFISTILLPRLTSFGMRLVIPLFVIFFPLMSYYTFKSENIPTFNRYLHSPSYIDRLYIWNEVASTIFEHPWLGIGMDGTPTHEKTNIIRKWSYIDAQGKSHETESAKFSMHPHNAILQLWLELGFIGVILGTLMAHLSLHQIFLTNLSKIERAICAGLFMGAFTIIWVNLGFWQNWWVSGLWIIIGLTIMSFKEQRDINEGELS